MTTDLHVTRILVQEWYGASRSSPASFYSHHYAAVSYAAVFSDVTTLHERAASLSRELSLPHA